MNLIPQQRDQVAAELEKFATDLNRTDDQKNKLKGLLEEAHAKVAEYLKAYPNVTKADVVKQVAAHRDVIRQQLVSFLNPQQLQKWDMEVAKAKQFLGQKMAA